MIALVRVCLSCTVTDPPPGVNFRELPSRLPSVLSPKYEVLCRRSVGCFSRRERSAHIFVIRVERATRKNSQLAPAQRVAMKMGRRLRCSSVTYRFRYAPLVPVRLGPPCRRPILNATICQLHMRRCTRSCPKGSDLQDDQKRSTCKASWPDFFNTHE